MSNIWFGNQIFLEEVDYQSKVEIYWFTDQKVVSLGGQENNISNMWSCQILLQILWAF